MLNVLFKTKPTKFRNVFYSNCIKAGIIFAENGYALDKIMFYEENGLAKDVFNDVSYCMDEESELYVGNVVSLDKLFVEYFGDRPLTLSQLYMGYKMFVNDPAFLNRYLSEFGMFEREVGYKGKTDIARDPNVVNAEKQELFEGLMIIINYNQINQKLSEYEISNVTKGK